MDEPVCPGCRKRDEIIARLQEQLATLEQRVCTREEQLGKNASNSSLSPFANPPQAPKPVVRKPTPDLLDKLIQKPLETLRIVGGGGYDPTELAKWRDQCEQLKGLLSEEEFTYVMSLVDKALPLALADDYRFPANYDFIIQVLKDIQPGVRLATAFG